jgi:D-alanyl-lipoteichoic acid acyltransferase DltB (MBOAT superfamily)
VIFNSVTYLIFLAIVVPLFWLLPRTPRLWLVFLASCTFYGFWRVEFLSIMLISATVDYFAAQGIYASADRWRRRLYLAASLGVNLGFLLYFKYLVFFADNARSLSNLLGLGLEIPALDIVLPLAISFYTFETISYTVDVYRGLIKPERSFLLYGCFITYFPHLIAGPILRAGEVMPQLSRRSRFDLGEFGLGFRRFLAGLFLKVVVADNISPMVDAGFAEQLGNLGAWDVWTLAFLFGFQIYFDFSAYSHIALGCSRMLGIRFPENFNFPYVATSPREFWRRWHISLSSWIRDYLYLPLAGASVDDRSVGGLGVAVDAGRRTRRTPALFLTWAIMGFWHGASWTFVLWGLYHATCIYVYRLVSPRTARLSPRLQALGGFALTLPITMLGWIPFRAASLGEALGMWAKLFDPGEYLHLGLRENTYLVTALLLLAFLLLYALQRLVRPALQQRPVLWWGVETAGLTAMVALVFVFLRPISQFIYFQF